MTLAEDNTSAPAATVSSLEFTDAEREHAATVVAIVGPIIAPLADALSPRTEVVLHDLTRFPGSIAAIGGSLTGRDVGGPPTDLGLRVFRAGWREHIIRYRTETEDGLVMRSSSLFFFAPSGKPVACLCINSDIDAVVRAQDALAAVTALAADVVVADEDGGDKPSESFPVSVESLTEGILREAIAAIGVPVALMKKPHKLRVVGELDRRGFFALREAAELAARRLDVSRYTIYNYLNELQSSSAPKPGT